MLAGSSWLQSVLGTLGKKDSDPASAAGEEANKRTVFGAAHSHFEQPATAAELQPPTEDEGLADGHLK